MNLLAATSSLPAESRGRPVGRLVDVDEPPRLTDVLSGQREAIIERAADVLSGSRARHYEAAGPELRRNRLEVLYDQTVKAVDSRNIGDVLTFARALAEERFTAGYDLSEIQIALDALEEAVWKQIFWTCSQTS